MVILHRYAIGKRLSFFAKECKLQILTKSEWKKASNGFLGFFVPF